MSQTYSSVPLVFSPTEWKHLTVTIDSIDKKIAFYENGVQVGESNLVNGFIPNISGINIGAKSNATDGITNYFSGELDNVMIHNRILDLDEIKMLSESKFSSIQNSNTWVHVGAAYDVATSNVSIYKNGAKVGEASNQTITIPTNVNEMRVGSNLKGLMDNFSMYERKLSDEEFKILGNIKRYYGQFYKSDTLLNCKFNEVISISKNLRAKYFLFEYLENYGNASVSTLADVKLYNDDVTYTPTRTIKQANTFEFIAIDTVSNISQMVLTNADNNAAIKRVAIYYAETLPAGRATVGDVTVTEFKAHSIFAQVFHLNKNADNKITDNIAVDVSGNGNHGFFSADPVLNSLNHYGGTYNKSVEIGQTDIIFNGGAFSNLDFSESYLSAWINIPGTLSNDVCIFKKANNFAFKCNKTTNVLSAEYLVPGTSTSNVVTSTLALANSTWTNVGVNFNRQNKNVTFFKKTAASAVAESQVLSNLTLNFNNSVNTDLRCFMDETVASTQIVLVDNLRVELGHFDGLSKFYEIADSNNEIELPKIPANTWTHLAATYESAKGKVKMYHDGVQIGEFNNYNVTPTDDSNQKVYIGKYNDNLLTNNTLLSDITVYDRVFTDSQVKDLYNNTK